MTHKTTLENGIRVVTEKIPCARSVAIGIIFDAGPRNETLQQCGLAHLCEHVMFQGTSSRDAMQIARLMDVGGGSMGAFTTRDYTCYYATVLDDYVTYALDLFGDVLLNSIFPEESLAHEKEAILSEIAGSNDLPSERVNNLLKSFVWPQAALGRPITGSPETICSLTREDVIYFVHTGYLPDRMIVAAAGNVDHEDFVAQVRDAFWRMLGHSHPLPIEPPVYQSGAVLENAPVSQAYFSLGVRAYPYVHPRRYGLHVLNNILGGGISSRLFRRIREERGLVYNIGSEYHAYREDGLWVIEGSTAAEYLLPVLGSTLVEIWKLIGADDAITDEELWRAKQQMRGQHLISGENTHTVMSRLATQEFYFGHTISSDEILAAIEAVSLESLQQISLEDFLEPLRQATLAVVGPEMPQAYNLALLQEMLADFR